MSNCKDYEAAMKILMRQWDTNSHETQRKKRELEQYKREYRQKKDLENNPVLRVLVDKIERLENEIEKLESEGEEINSDLESLQLKKEEQRRLREQARKLEESQDRSKSRWEITGASNGNPGIGFNSYF